MADHLCVLVHGLWGNPNHLKNVAKVLREKYSEDELHILVSKRNSGSFTYDGIELGGQRVCQEIEEELKRLSESGQTVKKLSMVGYSLGGLVARYTVGLLESRGLFDNIEAINFTTIATPHLGVRSPNRAVISQIFNVLGPQMLSMSGTQLFMVDNFRETGRPILEVMADPNSIFITGLRRFKRHSLYANITNDRTAPFYTTGISKIDPFVDLKAVDVGYLDGYEDVILDPTRPFSPKEKKILTFYSKLKHDASFFFRNLHIFALLTIVIPIGTLAFITYAGIQTILSSSRIRLHESGKAGIDPSSYRTPFLLDIREAVEDAYGNLNSAQSQQFLSAAPSTAGSSEDESEASGRPLMGNQAAEKPSRSTTKGLTNGNPGTDISPKETPTLALAPEQFTIIRNLDSVGWRKYFVHIHKQRHSHAAIIVRRDKEDFSEGFVVLRHWLDEFLME
ncbi:hypothetical protein VE01_07128 [Pseudogymnoascus verrucosus]|uniref:DUF676 domain-containing protein n=1 Tax=Pseudogymnoascus verrucosus TaxID=342668 RepID=A0A1B8GDY2_9PEZI|nr:uncharacterized protein VE01_07128 [Pseudogymnoascus verrucosus]OBT94036.1 hypothetical protein VE01_07128 [Pseudogymnoascus verrucosus]